MKEMALVATLLAVWCPANAAGQTTGGAAAPTKTQATGGSGEDVPYPPLTMVVVTCPVSSDQSLLENSADLGLH